MTFFLSSSSSLGHGKLIPFAWSKPTKPNRGQYNANIMRLHPEATSLPLVLSAPLGGINDLEKYLRHLTLRFQLDDDPEGEEETPPSLPKLGLLSWQLARNVSVAKKGIGVSVKVAHLVRHPLDSIEAIQKIWNQDDYEKMKVEKYLEVARKTVKIPANLPLELQILYLWVEWNELIEKHFPETLRPSQFKNFSCTWD